MLVLEFPNIIDICQQLLYACQVPFSHVTNPEGFLCQFAIAVGYGEASLSKFGVHIFNAFSQCIFNAAYRD